MSKQGNHLKDIAGHMAVAHILAEIATVKQQATLTTRHSKTDKEEVTGIVLVPDDGRETQER